MSRHERRARRVTTLRRRPHAWAGEGERGSNTVLMLGVVTALILLMLGGLTIGRAYLAHSAARTAADLGALAGASARVAGGDPCRAAARVASANGGEVTACTVDGLVVEVEVSVPSGIPAIGPARVDGRAGPASARGGGQA